MGTMTDEILIHFRLVGDEADALRVLSIAEMRSPCNQIRFMLHQELTRRGLLPADDQHCERQDQGGGDGSGG